MDVISNGIITRSGISAIIEANATGSSIKIGDFGYTDQDILLNEDLTTENITPWIKKAISSVSREDENTVTLVTVVEATEAIKKCRAVAYYLEDGSLFALAKPFQPMNEGQRQTYETQYEFSNASVVMEINLVPIEEQERFGVVLDTSMVLGLQSMKNLSLLKRVIKIQGVEIQ